MTRRRGRCRQQAEIGWASVLRRTFGGVAELVVESMATHRSTASQSCRSLSWSRCLPLLASGRPPATDLRPVSRQAVRRRSASPCSKATRKTVIAGLEAWSRLSFQFSDKPAARSNLYRLVRPAVLRDARGGRVDAGRSRGYENAPRDLALRSRRRLVRGESVMALRWQLWFHPLFVALDTFVPDSREQPDFGVCLCQRSAEPGHDSSVADDLRS